jgi:hypothetical protein
MIFPRKQGGKWRTVHRHASMAKNGKG